MNKLTTVTAMIESLNGSSQKFNFYSAENRFKLNNILPMEKGLVCEEESYNIRKSALIDYMEEIEKLYGKKRRDKCYPKK
ncbi:hypothetical protein AB6735_06905 [Mucilaginibacter sp. RCC_168]|uniref:hypothetical protein n=1 Tax=Mucilaginibacter sp. RCC_168 TaxID=3239221 RepID=UPI003525EE4F